MFSRDAAPAEPTKHPDFIYYQKEPLNGAPPPFLARGEFITPFDLFYVRSPRQYPAAFRRRVPPEHPGLVARPVELSLGQLRRDFPAHRIGVTLQCAGNRRDELKQVKDIPGEAPWAGNAISHGVWTGARLADVLAHAGLDRARARFVEFIGHDKAAKKDHPHFGGSVPLSKALAPETLLAYELDGQPLPVVHGFPVRAIVPGYLGRARSSGCARSTCSTIPRITPTRPRNTGSIRPAPASTTTMSQRRCPWARCP